MIYTSKSNMEEYTQKLVSALKGIFFARSTDKTLTIEGEPADAKATGDAVGEVSDLLSNVIEVGTEEVAVDFSAAGGYKACINDANKWSTGKDRVGYILKRIEGAKAIEITANSNANTYWALLKTTAHASQTTPDYCDGYNSRQTLAMGTSITVQLPDDCNYIYVQGTFYGTVDNTPESFVFQVEYLDKKWEQPPIGLHTMPENSGVLNVIKRCRQMTDIRWTPAVDLKRLMLTARTMDNTEDYSSSMDTNWVGVFKAGHEYKGIPYGRCDFLGDYGYSNSFAGLNVGFDVFITSVENPESIVSKEIQTDTRVLNNHRTVPYAAVCSALVCYALNVSYVPTSNIPSIPGLNLISALTVDGSHIPASTFRLGDILNLQGQHTVVVTDIALGDSGDVRYIEVSEATTGGEANPDIEGGDVGGLCRRVGYTVDDFFARFQQYSLLRYAYIDNVSYTPSPYVNVGDEMPMFCLRRLPCIPYMGENFKYKVGYIPNTKIVITTDNYSFLRVFKDGTEISGSPFAVDASLGYVETGFADAGSYEAYLCNMSSGVNTAVTVKCHWTVT